MDNPTFGSWISVDDQLPEEHEIIWGSANGKAWVFKWSEEHGHFLEYTDKRGGRWEYTNFSYMVTHWTPLLDPLPHVPRETFQLHI